MNIVWQRPDGISITHIFDDSDPVEHAKELQKRGDIPADWVAVDFAVEVPEDRTYRNAWTHDGEIKCDLNKAGDIQLNKIRDKRNKELEKLDIEAIKNISNPEILAKIEADKQILRDLPATILPEIKACKNTEELKKVYPFTNGLKK